ncbi:MAG TPA: glycoside hydrolase family 3 N-terminal domain-containing protein [Thermoanaerobaculia bacterium]|nr:glycoside hydrolase family 3 N-terminal domain-containing protein [Thermoanaerobaculia bacterium]
MRAAEHVFVGIPGPSLEPADAALLARQQPGGVVLLPRNIGSSQTSEGRNGQNDQNDQNDQSKGSGGNGAGAVEQLVELVAELRRIVPGALLAIDAEGGRVDRLRELVGPAPAAAWLARRPPAVALQSGRWIAMALRLFDLDVDFAPVVDLDRGERGNALDGRYLGARGAQVTPRARAFLRGLHGGGIGGCLKHFPGLGAATHDTHHRPAVITQSAAELEPDLRPFRSLLPLAGAAMIGHGIYPALDPNQRPASLSPEVLEDLLRGRLGFDGLAVSDDLEMEALGEWGDLPARAVAAFTAGCDVVLLCASPEALPEVAAGLDQPRLLDRRREAARRLAVYRQRLRTLRWTSQAVSLIEEPARTDRLATIREGLAALQRA